jgi:hypothetical protein
VTNIAPVRGTTSLYSHMENSTVLLMRDGYKYFVTSLKVFNDLYISLTDTKAALKEDCIEYVIYRGDVDSDSYPDWYIDALDNHIFENGYNGHTFRDMFGITDMTPGAVILRNFKGELMYMDYNKFERYYEILGGTDYEF